jgi:arylsulfatase A-like enzyme
VKDAQGNPITPNIDRLAAAGTRFTNGYVACPICSPSRVAVLTGMVPGRHGIHTYLDNKAYNDARNANDWLQPDTVTSARLFRDAGYVTGNFGKWHMGGGRDVNDPPFPQAYGFQQSLVDFQGSGDRVMYIGDGLSQQNADVPGNITWAQWYDGSRLFADAAMAFIENAVAQNKPFYIHVPFNDVHDAYHVAPGHENDFAHATSDATAKIFLGNLHAMDEQVGRLLDKLDALGIAQNTLVVLMGDNGAPNNDLNVLLSRNGGMKGGKGSLWEGGIRESYIVRMPGVVPAGKVNNSSIVSTLDLLPTFCELAGISVPPAPYDGESVLDIFKGSNRQRTRPLFWEFGAVSNLAPNSPKLAMREGKYKFLRDPEGTKREFYDLTADRNETTNQVANAQYAPVVTDMEDRLLRWYREVELGEVGEVVETPSQPPGVLIADTFDVAGGASATTGFGAGAGVNQGLSGRLSGQFASDLSYARITTDKVGTAHAISDNGLVISQAAGATAFGLVKNGSQFDFGPYLRGRKYEWRVMMDLDDAVPAHARMTLGIADSAGPDGGVGGHVLAVQLDRIDANNTSVFRRIDATANSGGGDINAAIRTGLPAGEPVDVRVVMQDSTDYSGFNTTYEIYLNGTLANSGNIRFRNDSRYLIFDTAPDTGPARYDNFAVESLEAGPPLQKRLPIVHISQTSSTAVADVERARLYWTTQPGQTSTVQISKDLVNWGVLLNNGAPVTVTTEEGTLQWREVVVPAEYRDKAFFRLETAVAANGPVLKAATATPLPTSTPVSRSKTAVASVVDDDGEPLRVRAPYSKATSAVQGADSNVARWLRRDRTIASWRAVTGWVFYSNYAAWSEARRAGK